MQSAESKYHFAPSMMCADLLHLADQMQVINRRGWLYHVDIMDGHYVHNLTLSPVFIRQMRPLAELPIDAHLMVEDPADYLDALAEAGADYISVHAETVNRDAFRILRRIRELGCRPGIVLNPATPLDSIRHYASLIDKLTIMTVDAGFAGQAFIPEMLDKFREAASWKRQYGYHFYIEADGSCNEGTFSRLKEAGCEVFIVGTSGLFSLDRDLDRAFDRLEDIFDHA